MNRRHLLRSVLAGSTGLALGRSLFAEPAGGGRSPRRGVNVCGAEFGVTPEFCNDNPGRIGREYTYNSERTVAYFADHGLTLLRVPFRWERIQPKLGAPLDAAELDRLRQFIGWAAMHRASVILDVHNFARYRLRHGGRIVEPVIDQSLDGAVPVTHDHFADLWRRLSAAFRAEPAVEAYGLMNEPHDMGRSDWKAISQAAVSAIRREGDRTLVLVPGESYSNSDRFAQINGPKAWIDDPADRTAYEAHCYFDANYSGVYAQSYDAEVAKDKDLPQRGARRLHSFLTWCRTNNVRGVLGEFGVPGDDPRWLDLLPPFLAALGQAGVAWCWWAAGEWWGGYKLSLQPRDDFKRPAPQLAALRT